MQDSIRYFSDEISNEEIDEYYLSEDHPDRLSIYLNSYANRKPESATVYLQRMIDNYLEAVWLPCRFAIFSISEDLVRTLRFVVCSTFG